MKNKHIIFAFIFLIFTIFGLLLFYKSIKEIKEAEKEISFKPPSIEADQPPNFKENEFKFKTLDGKVFELNDFKGKVVFLTFWATWCRFCAMELPHIQKLYEEYKGKDIEFVALSAEGKEKVEKYINNFKYTFPAYIQLTPTPSIFKSEGIPVNFILDKEGKVKLKKEGYYNWLSEEAKNFLNSLL